MTMDEAKNVLKMTADQLVHYDLVDSALLANLTSQRDDTLARIEAFDTEKAELNAKIAEKDALLALIGDDAALAEIKKQKEISDTEAKLAQVAIEKLALEEKLADLNK